MAVQPDGKIVQAGSVKRNGTGDIDFGVVRYNATSFIDNTFGTSGKVITPIGLYEDYLNAIVIQPDGKILVAGRTTIDQTTCNSRAVIVRYNTDGSLDNTFGTGGKQLLSMSANAATANAITVQPDGKILVGGNVTTTKLNVLLARLNSNGSYDNTFGTNGIVITSPGLYIDGANAIALQGDGKIVLSGSSYSASTSQAANFLLLRYNTNGTLDNTLNGNGSVISTNIPNGIAKAVALQPDGKIVLAGSGMNPNNSNSTDMVLVCYTNTGALDNTFATTGTLFSPLVAGQPSDYANSVIIQADGKLIVGGNIFYGGTTGTNFAIARFTTAGVLDNTFASNGKYFAATSIGNYGTVAFQGTNILGSDMSNENSGRSFVVFRLNNSVGAALPLTYTLINAKCRNSNVTLTWQTAQEANSLKFEVERSNGNSWIAIGSVNAAGNSNNIRNYTFTDPSSQAASLYRIAEIDKDERKSYRSILKSSCQQTEGLEVWPNPVYSNVTIQISTALAAKLQLELYDSKGRLMMLKQESLLQGSNSISLNLNNLSAGVYTLRAAWGSNSKATKITKE